MNCNLLSSKSTDDTSDTKRSDSIKCGLNNSSINPREEVGFFYLRDTALTLIVPKYQNHSDCSTNIHTAHNSKSTVVPQKEEHDSAHNNDLPFHLKSGIWMDVVDASSTNSQTDTEDSEDERDHNETDNSSPSSSPSSSLQLPSPTHQPPAKKRKCNDYSELHHAKSEKESPYMITPIRATTPVRHGTTTESSIQVTSSHDNVSSQKSITSSSSTPPTPPPSSQKDDPNICSRCNLIFRLDDSNSDNDRADDDGKDKSQSSRSIQFREEDVASFSGCVEDMANFPHDHQKRKRKQRSDAALLMGTIISCRSMGYVRIERIQILIHKREEAGNFEGVVAAVDHGDDCAVNGNGNGGWNYVRVKASIVITVSLPYLEQFSQEVADSMAGNAEAEVKLKDGGDDDDCNDGRRKPGRKRKRSKINQPAVAQSTKAQSILPPSAQLLFSLIRSDWTRLDHDMVSEARKLRNKVSDRGDAVSIRGYNDIKEEDANTKGKRLLFPSELSLEQLYSRIECASDGDFCNVTDYRNKQILTLAHCITPSSTTPHLLTNHKHDHHPSLSPSAVSLLMVPEVIIQEKIAGQYLGSKSLHSLRGTCRYLYHILRSVVPGLRLRLFRHQMRSLNWMRRREGVDVTEADAIIATGMSFSGRRDCRDRDGDSRGRDNVAFGERILDGDLYRATSTGSAVTIVPRRRNRVNCSGTNDGKSNVNCSSNIDEDVAWIVNVRDGSVSWTRTNLNTAGTDDNNKHCINMTVAATKKVARGGLLCDDPGLGKTITVLSLILQTFGQTTEQHKDCITDGDAATTDEAINIASAAERSSTDAIFDAYWKGGTNEVLRQADLAKLIVEHKDMDKYRFFDKSPEKEFKGDDKALEEYKKVIERQICLDDVRRRARNDGYKNNFDDFCKDIHLCYRNAMEYYDSDSIQYEMAKDLLPRSKQLIKQFKLYQLAEAERCLSRSKNLAQTSFGALLRLRSKTELSDSLHSSCATLLVVPNTLTQHWEDQIKMHLDWSFCTNKRPLLYRFGGKGKGSNSQFDEVNSMNRVMSLCTISQTHCPLVFIDESGAQELPPPEFLAMFCIVITTSKRLTLEWKNGSAEEELKRSNQRRSNPRFSVRGKPIRFKQYNYDNNVDEKPACSLLKVRWLRLIVDEGHSMGKGAYVNSIQFASWITAQRRWAMTGTPTPQLATRNGLRNLFGLMKFLKHDDFSMAYGGDLKSKNLREAFNLGYLSVFFQLRSLLNLLMIRHTKHDIELPKPQFKRTYIDMSTAETLAYNTLVSAVQMNIVPTSMESKTSGFQDSILNSKQAKYAHEALRNIRLACSGGTKVAPNLSEKNWELTLEKMEKVHKAKEIDLILVNNFLTRMTNMELTNCMVCGLQLQTLFLLPCGCQVCTECVTSKTVNCPACKKKFDADEFQLLQPGLEYTWKWNIEEAEKERESAARLQQVLNETAHQGIAENHRNVWAVGEEEPVQNDNPIDNPPGNVNESQRVGLIQGGRRRRRRNAEHQCVFPNVYTDGKCTICGEVHIECNLVKEGSQCSICHCVSEDCPKDESKAYYVITKLLRLYIANREGKLFPRTSSPQHVGKTPRLKVILFSQFRQILNVVGDRLIRKFGTGCIAEYWGKTRNKELERFSKTSDCFCMLLGKDGSHGLDLSFVTHIFFLDEIMDKSLESQVVARAYRMGSIQRVQVEQLVSRKTVEELMVQMNSETSTKNLYDESSKGGDTSSPDSPLTKYKKEVKSNLTIIEKTQEQAKVRFLLSNLKLIRTGHVPSKCCTKKKENVRRRVNFML